MPYATFARCERSGQPARHPVQGPVDADLTHEQGAGESARNEMTGGGAGTQDQGQVERLAHLAPRRGHEVEEERPASAATNCQVAQVSAEPAHALGADCRIDEVPGCSEVSVTGPGECLVSEDGARAEIDDRLIRDIDELFVDQTTDESKLIFDERLGSRGRRRDGEGLGHDS